MALGGKHTLPGFEQALESLRTDGALMATLVSRSLTNAKLGFAQRDDDYCAAVIADDEEVDLLQKQVDRGGHFNAVRADGIRSSQRSGHDQAELLFGESV
jgi:hypothetical protein